MHSVQSALEEMPGFIGKQPLQKRHPGEMPTLNDVLKELNAKDPELDKPIDIGFPKNASLSEDELEQRKKCLEALHDDLNLEKAARLRTLKLDLDEVKTEWDKTVGPDHIKIMAEHFGIFRDLFDGAHFMPTMPLAITYDYDDETVTPVYRGNHIQPSEASKAPQIHFKEEPNSLWTLVLTNPDGHLLDSSAEYLHWFVGNIPENSVRKGDLVCDYLQPFPPKGTGFHRFVFVLYKQKKHMDYSQLQKSLPCLSLKDRSFKTYEFYKQNQDLLTPAGLAFFQCDWEESLKEFFHKVLVMREPVFEYDHPPPYIRTQRIIPHREPFNLYLDKYRDPKDIGKEILLKRFKTVHPFREELEKPKHPNIYPYPKNCPSWSRTEIFKERMRIGKYRGLDIEIFKPERPKRAVLGDFSRKEDSDNELK